MSSIEEDNDKCGSLLFFRKTGEPGTSYPLTKGETCIGSSDEADIRLRMKDDRLERIHCIIDVAENGIATIFNKSQNAPVCVNGITVKVIKVLYDKDRIELVGKQFQYLNDEVSRKELEKHEALLSKMVVKKRQSVAPLVNVQSTSKSTNAKSRTSVEKKLSRKSFNGRLTPRRSLVVERPGTTSKLVVSKALGSPTRPRKRRLSMDDIHRKRDRNPISERNILLSKNIVSSVISEEDEQVPSLSQGKNGVATDFLDVSNTSSSEKGMSVTRRSSVRTPVKVTVTAPTPVKTPRMKTPVNGESKLAGRKSSLTKIETPKTPPNTKRFSTGVESSVKTPVSTGKPTLRQKSVGSIVSTRKSKPDRRKSEGSQPNGRKSKITSAENETLEVLNISSGSSRSYEKRMSSDPRLVLGKATPRKSVKQAEIESETFKNNLKTSESRRSSKRTRRSSLGNASLNGDESEETFEEETERNAQKTPSSSEESERDESLNRKTRDSEVTSRISMSRRSTRSYLSETTSETHGPLPDESFETSISSMESLNLTVHSTSSSLSDISDIKPLFVPQRRPSLRRTYVEECRNLISLSRPSTPQTESKEANTSKRWNVKTAEEEETIVSVQSDDTIRVSRRRNSTKYCRSCGVSPPSRRSSTSVFDRSELEQNDSAMEKSGRFTPQPRKSLLQSRQRSSATPLSASWRSNSVILVDDDSVKHTPENNTSIVILETPFEETGKRPHRLSKTLNSTIEDYVETSTPKLTTKGRRSKSLPYKPIVEQITPVTPIETPAKQETSFKTPLNTPGLFENIKKSVLKSRGRRGSHNLMEELNKAAKRPRESTGSTDRSPKKKKVLPDTTLDSDMDEDLDSSFASFATEEIFADENVEPHLSPDTPEGFKNLTDKPLVTRPQTKCLTEPRKQKSAPKRLSLHAMKLESRSSEQDSSFGVKSRTSTESTGSRRSRRLSIKAERENKAVKSPENDLREVAGVKKLFATPKESKPPKNDLTKVPNLRKLMYPTNRNSPKNDLSDVAGLKKLLTTPKKVKSPRNDLRTVPNLRRIMSPKHQNSPKNDLSDVAGLKKLLSTPKKLKEPKNDLTNVKGVKKLLSTPKNQKSPLNDLTKVPNLRRMMSPKQEKPPENDLSNVSGVAELFVATQGDDNKSNMENNEELFDQLFVKKPIRTYRGKSVSPITRKAMVFGGDQRKTLGDTPYSSPMIEKWLQEQAVIRIERAEGEAESSRKVSPGNNERQIDDTEETVEEKQRPRTRRLEIEIDEKLLDSPRSLRSRRKKTVDSPLTIDLAESSSTVSELRPKRGRARKLSQKEEAKEQIVAASTKKLRGKKKLEIDVESADTEESSASKRTGKLRVQKAKTDSDENTETVTLTVPKRGRRLRTISRDNTESTEDASSQERNVSSTDTEVAPPPKRRGRARNVVDKDEDDSEVEFIPPPKRRGRTAVAHSTPQKTTGKRGTKKVVIEENVEEETGKKTTSRRKNQKVESTPEETEKSVKKTARRGKAKEQDTDESSETSRPRRGRAQQVIETSDSAEEEDKENVQDNAATKRETRRKNKKSDSDNEAKEPPKRGGRAKTVIEDQEGTAKENVDKPRTRRQPAKKTKVTEVLQETFEDSPRTARQKKAKFNKYGSDFLTEQAPSKTVQFEETKSENATNKRKGKTVQKTEEETVRRSKRTRK